MLSRIDRSKQGAHSRLWYELKVNGTAFDAAGSLLIAHSESASQMAKAVSSYESRTWGPDRCIIFQ